MATLYLKTAGGNWTAAGTWSNVNAGGGDNSGPPTAADDCIAELLSGPVTINTGAVCRSWDCTSGTGSYTGTATHTAGVDFQIGDGTAGAGNRALRLSAGMTYTLGNASTSLITFVSTSATQQDVNFDAKATGNVTYNATSNGSWILSSAHSTASTALVTLTKGTLNLNGQTLSIGGFNSSNANTRVLTLGAADISINSTLTWNLGTVTGLTFSGASSTIRLTATSINVSGGGQTYGTMIFNNCGSSGSQLSQANTIGTLTITGTAVKTDIMIFNANQTITANFNVNGNSVINRVFLTGSTTAAIGSQKTVTNTVTTMNWTNCDIRDIALTVAYNASGVTGGSGDCGGNSNITFTTPATQTATGTTSFTWSTHGWTTRVPLPQDDVVINNSFVAGQTVTSDMPRSGRSVSFAGCSGSPNWTWSVLLPTIYGSLNTTGVGTHTSGGNTFIFEGRAAFTWTTGGVVYTGGFTIQMVGGTMTLTDNLSMNNTSVFTLNNGTFNAAGFNVTARRVSITGTPTRALTMGSGTWTLISASAEAVWNATTVTGLTLTSTGSTILISDTGAATNKSFIGGGLTYNNLTVSSTSTGIMDFTGSNTFGVFTINAPRTVRFTAGTTTTVSSFVAMGASGNVITISSITAATHTLSDASGTNSADWLNLTNSIAGGGAAWYAGANSVDNGGNSGWIFAAGPGTTFPGQIGQRLLMGVGM